MTRTGTLLAITLASLLATPIVVHATSMPKQRMAQAQGASVPAMDVVTPPQQPEAATCTRKVKVVYAGYGEGRTRCAAPIEGR